MWLACLNNSAGQQETQTLYSGVSRRVYQSARVLFGQGPYRWEPSGLGQVRPSQFHQRSRQHIMLGLSFRSYTTYHASLIYFAHPVPADICPDLGGGIFLTLKFVELKSFSSLKIKKKYNEQKSREVYFF